MTVYVVFIIIQSFSVPAAPGDADPAYIHVVLTEALYIVVSVRHQIQMMLERQRRSAYCVV